VYQGGDHRYEPAHTLFEVILQQMARLIVATDRFLASICAGVRSMKLNVAELPRVHESNLSFKLSTSSGLMEPSMACSKRVLFQEEMKQKLCGV
jgi:hypothetical protein